MFLTAQLVFTIFMLAAEKHRATFIAPVGIGLSLFIAELMGVYYTGGSLNPARSFGPCVVLHSFYSYHWIYWVGPILGSLLASGFYMFIKALEHETVNPEQDAAGEPARVFDPNTGVEKRVDPETGVPRDGGNLYNSNHGQMSTASAGAAMMNHKRGSDERTRTRANREPDLEAGRGMPAEFSFSITIQSSDESSRISWCCDALF